MGNITVSVAHEVCPRKENMGTWKAVADALVKAYRESPRFMAVMCVICAMLLFLPPRYLAPLAVESWVLQYRPYIGGLFLIFAGMTISYPVHKGWCWGVHKIKNRGYKKAIMKRLGKLDTTEKVVLTAYISKNLRTQYFYFNHATVANLRLCRILFIPPTPGTIYDKERIPHVIVEWVWDYLHEHPEVLK